MAQWGAHPLSLSYGYSMVFKFADLFGLNIATELAIFLLSGQ